MWRRALRLVLYGMQGALIGGGLAGCVVYHTNPVVVPLARADDADRVHVDFVLDDGTSASGGVVAIRRVAPGPGEAGASGDPTWSLVVRPSSGADVTVDLQRVVQAKVGDVVVPQAVSPAGAVALVLVGIIVVVLVIGVIAAATKSSCPFVYVDGPTGPVLVGEGYSGAVAGALQRADRLLLPPMADGTVNLRLVDAAAETQYTDAAWLVVVDGVDGQRALATTDGRTVMVGPAVAPDSVVDLEGTDFTAIVAVDDDRAWSTDMIAASRAEAVAPSEGLVARLAHAPDAAALEIVFQNQPWLDVVSGVAWSALGSRLDTVQVKNRDPAEREQLLARLEAAGLRPTVEVRDGEGWRVVQTLSPPGWVATRRLVVPLEGVRAGEPVEVRIRGAVGFLRIAYVGFASVTDEAPPELRIDPSRAVGSDGSDQLANLAAVDGACQILPDRGAELSLAFELPPVAEGRHRAVFLHLDGFYEVHQRPAVHVDLGTLPVLGRHPERMSELSVSLFRSLQEGDLLAAE